MTNLQKDLLLELYAMHSIDEIDNNFGVRIAEIMGKANYSDLKDVEEFNGYSLLLKQCRSEVELLKANSSPLRQICAALDSLYCKRNQGTTDEYNIYIAIYRATLYKDWERKMQEQFDYAIKNIIQKRQVFISYTTRNAQLNNALYSDLIENFVDEHIINDANHGSKRNLIVWAIKQHLIDNNQLTGYFDQDKHDYEYGRELPQMLKDKCEDCLTFLQILEKRIFDRDKEENPNYCYKEFSFYYVLPQANAAGPVNAAKALFIVRNTPVKDMPIYPANFPNELQGWKAVVDPIKYLPLYEGKSLREFLIELETISQNILSRAEEILNTYKEKIKADAGPE